MEDNKSPTYELAEQDYIAGMKYKDIAEKYGVSINTVKSWKGRYNWSKDKKSVHTKKKKVCTQTKKLESEKEPITEEVDEVIGSDGLTKKQRLFCLYYIEDFNATRSYKRAYKCDYETAMASGSRMLRNVKVKNEIDRLTEECLQEKEIDSKLISKRLLQKFIDIAFSNINDFIEVEIKERERDDGSVARWNNIIVYEEFDGSIVSEISQGKDGVKVKLADKIRALEFLAKYNNVLSADIREKLELERKKVEIAQSKVPSKEDVDLQGQITALANLINNPVEERVLEDD